MQKFKSALEDLKVPTQQLQQLYSLQEQYITSMVKNIKARFASSSPLLAALRIFNPMAVSDSSEFGFTVYGNREISTLAESFFQGDADAKKKTRSNKPLAEWQQIKFSINENVKPNIPTQK